MATIAPVPGRWSPCRGLSLPPRRKHGCCLPLDTVDVRKPDPSTYDQQRLLSMGMPVSFNSLDIDTVNFWPVTPIPELNVRLRNLSTEVPAPGTRVDMAWSRWGIGQVRTAVGSAAVDLAPGAEGAVKLATPPALMAEKRFGLFVRVSHPHDKDPNNNTGEQTVDGMRTSEGRTRAFQFPVRNPGPGAGTVQLQVLPGPAAAWCSLSGSSFPLGPGAETPATLTIAVPAAVPNSPPGTQVTTAVDVMATLNGGYLGGVSVFILVDG